MAGGGGGISHLYNTPQYQEGVPGVNTFNARQYVSNLMQPRMNPVLVSGTDYGRNYPDVSANADPLTGYDLYDKALGGWQVTGGTSFVAPQFNGATAVMNSGKGQRMGLWNTQIYQLAQDKDKNPFTVMDSTTNNSNLYYTGQPGKIYNQATGLGTVNFEKLYDSYQ
jgi:subtilase family serine protease